MDREAILKRLRRERVIAVIRLGSAQDLPALAEALSAGGVRGIEVTLSTPNAIEGIRDLDHRYGDDLFVGVGSVLDAETAKRAVDAGAKYVVSPIFDERIVKAAQASGVAAMPGCFTPTEIHRATEAGADVVKVFPADVLGMAFFKGVLAPMPHLRLMPTGGVTLENAGDWLRAGAIAVGAGSSLCPKGMLSDRDWAGITKNAQRIRASADAED